MSHNNADINELVALGLTTYEAKAYLSLIGRENATAVEVAQLARIPRQRIYDVLGSLSEKGLVVTVASSTTTNKGARYRAQPPDQVTERLLSVQQRELDRRATSIRDLTERLLPLYTSGQTHDEPLDYVEVIKDAQLAVYSVQKLWAQAGHEVLTFVGPPYIAPPEPSEAALPTAVTLRAVYERSLIEDPKMVELLSRYQELGEHVRLIDEVPLKMTVVDEQAAVFNMPDPVSDGRASVTTLIVRHPALASTLKIAFEAVWAQSEALDQALAERE